MGPEQVAQGSSRLIESGVLGAVLFLMFAFFAYFVFKYYLPAQASIQVEREKLNAENQANRDKYNQQQVSQLLEIMKDTNARYDAHDLVSRQEHAKAFDMQREFYKSEMEQARMHGERTVEKVCEAVAGLERVVERTSVMVLALAESQGRGKDDLLDRVEELTGEHGLREKYRTKGGWEDDEESKGRQPGHGGSTRPPKS